MSNRWVGEKLYLSSARMVWKPLEVNKTTSTTFQVARGVQTWTNTLEWATSCTSDRRRWERTKALSGGCCRLSLRLFKYHWPLERLQHFKCRHRCSFRLKYNMLFHGPCYIRLALNRNDFDSWNVLYLMLLVLEMLWLQTHAVMFKVGSCVSFQLFLNRKAYSFPNSAPLVADRLFCG